MHTPLTHVLAQGGPPSDMVAFGPLLMCVCAMVAVVAAVAVGVLIGFYWRGRRDNQSMTCGKCGYSVKGLESMTCPECGADLREVGIKRGKAQS